jgi:hypothetical protein
MRGHADRTHYEDGGWHPACRCGWPGMLALYQPTKRQAQALYRVHRWWAQQTLRRRLRRAA